MEPAARIAVPALVFGQCGAFGEDQFTEPLDTELLQEELDACTAAVAFLTEAREHARDGLREG